MPEPPRIDCLIVSYNTRELTRQTISTLLAHSQGVAADVTVSVWDNASQDGSAEMLAAEFPEVRLHRSAENVGFGAANNALARSSSADYLLLLNSDVIVTEDLLSPLLTELHDRPRTVAVGPRLVDPDGSPQYSAPRFPTLRYEFALAIRGKRLSRRLRPMFDAEAIIAAHQEVTATLARADRSCDFIWATCWLLRRAEVAEGIFDAAFPMYDEDLDFCRGQVDAGREFRYLGRVSLTHIGGASSPSDRSRFRLVRRSRRRYYRRYHGRLTAAVYLALVPLAAWTVAALDRALYGWRRTAQTATV